MSDWQMWMGFAAVVVGLEIVTGTFYLLMVSVGLAAGALVAGLGASTSMQASVAAIVAVIATGILKRSKFGKNENGKAERDPNVNMDIGQMVSVEKWKHEVGGKHTARVMYRGALWNIELEPDREAKPGSFKIVEVRGSHLIVTNTMDNS